MEHTDSELIHDYLKGDSRAFSSLVDKHLPAVYAFVYRLTGNKDEASDISQESFVKVWKNISRYDHNQNFKTWLFTIARNTTIDFLRKRREIVFSKMEYEEGEGFGVAIPDPEPLPDVLFEKKEIKEKVEGALNTLSPDQKTVVILHYKDGLTFEQIGKVVGKSVNTVKSQYRRSLASLRKYLE